MEFFQYNIRPYRTQIDKYNSKLFLKFLKSDLCKEVEKIPSELGQDQTKKIIVKKFQNIT